MVVLAVALVLRMGIAVAVHQTSPERLLAADSRQYLDAADALRTEARFTYSPDDDRPQYVRTPGYPAFIAATWSALPDSALYVVLLQAIAGTVTALLAYATAARLWARPVPLLAALLVAIEPLQLLSAGVVLTECLFTTLLMAFVWAAVTILTGTPRPGRWALGAGLALALATFVRPTTYYFPLLVAAVLLVVVTRSGGRRRALVVTAVFLAPSIVLIGGWQARNHERVGSWRFSGIEGVNNYLNGAPRVLATANDTTLDAERRTLLDEVGSRSLLDAQLRTPDRFASQGAFYDLMARRGLELQLEHPVELARVTSAGIVRIAAGIGTESLFPYVGLPDPPLLVLVPAGAALVAFYTFCAIGLARGRRQAGTGAAQLLLVVTVAYVFVASSSVPQSRYRTPVMPILCCYAAAGLVSLGKKTSSRVSTWVSSN